MLRAARHFAGLVPIFCRSAATACPLSTLKRIIQNAVAVLNGKERRRLLRLILLHTFISIADIAALALLLALIHFYTQPGAQQTALSQGIFLQLQAMHFLLPLLLFFSLFLIKNLVAFLATKAQYDFIYGVASRIAKTKMQQYLDGSFEDYTQLNPSVHVSRISYQPVEYGTFVLAGIQQLATEATLTLVAIIAILLFNAQLFLLLLLVLLPPVILSAYWSRKRLNAARGHVKESSEKAVQHLHEALASYVESNVFDRKAFFTNRYAASQKRLSATLSELQITQAIPTRLMELFAVLGLLVLIMVNQYTGNTAMELVNIGAFAAAAYKIIPGVTRMANTGAQMRMYAYTMQHIAEGAPANQPQHPATASVSSIAFKNVSFSHGHHRILDRFHMQLRRGDFAGISSDSGRGKTTMLNLLLGFLKPDSGAICFNKIETTEAERQAFWPHIAYVKQQPFMIHGSIRQNILLDESGGDEQRLGEAIRMAGLCDFVTAFPEGLEKTITDAGKNISGGQRQRIALARAFYKAANLLILDEPFSELDAASEQAILQHLQALAAQGKMIILITHNKASLGVCNKIFAIHA